MKPNKDELIGLLNHFRTFGVSHDPSNGLDKTLRFQDIVGHANKDEIFEAYLELEKPDKRTFLWASSAALCPETAESIIIYTTVRQLRKAEIENLNDEISKEWEKVDAETRKVEGAKKSFHKRLKHQKDEMANLRRKLSWMEKDRDEYRDKLRLERANIANLSEDAAKFAEIKRLLS